MEIIIEIHNNPINAVICKFPEDYIYSSVRYYFDGTDSWNMLSNLYEKFVVGRGLNHGELRINMPTRAKQVKLS